MIIVYSKLYITQISTSYITKVKLECESAQVITGFLSFLTTLCLSSAFKYTNENGASYLLFRGPEGVDFWEMISEIYVHKSVHDYISYQMETI